MRDLYESILDSDEQIKENARLNIAREWMRDCTRAYQNKCEEGKDWYFDQNGNIHIYGDCTGILISSNIPTGRKYSQYVHIASLSTSSHCQVIVKDPDAAMNILPVQMGPGGKPGFEIIYDTKKNLEPKHFPLMVNGNIRIDGAGNVNLRIMPDCTGELKIDERKCGNVTYPNGFPSSAKEIEITR